MFLFVFEGGEKSMWQKELGCYMLRAISKIGQRRPVGPPHVDPKLVGGRQFERSRGARQHYHHEVLASRVVWNIAKSQLVVVDDLADAVQQVLRFAFDDNVALVARHEEVTPLPVSKRELVDVLPLVTVLQRMIETLFQKRGGARCLLGIVRGVRLHGPRLALLVGIHARFVESMHALELL